MLPSTHGATGQHWDLIMSIQLGRVSNYPCLMFDIAGAGVVFCQQRGADLHMTQLTPLPLTVSCFSKTQTGFTFLVLACLLYTSPSPRD